MYSAHACLPGDGNGEVTSCGPLKVMSTKCGVRDPEIQVLMFDIEALICNLLTEENPLLAGNYSNVSHLVVYSVVAVVIYV